MMTEHRLIVNKLTKAQYEQSSKNPNEVWIITDQLDDYAKTDDLSAVADSIPTSVSELTNDLNLIGGLMRIWKPFIPFERRPLTFINNGMSDTTIASITEGVPPELGMEYSLDEGETWDDFYDNTYVTIPSGESIQLRVTEDKQEEQQWSSAEHAKRVLTFGAGASSIEVEGNINSLVRFNYSDPTTYDIPIPNWNFFKLFENATAIVNAENVVMPSTSIGDFAYDQVFMQCSNLVKAPQRIDVENINQYGMMMMFSHCTNLATPPNQIKFRSARYQCCAKMFEYCTNLTYSPRFTEFEYGWDNAFMSAFSYCPNIQHLYFPKYKGNPTKMFTQICNGSSSYGTVHTMSNTTYNPYGMNWVYSYENQEDADPLTFEATGSSYNQVRLRSIEGTAPTLNLNYRFKYANDADYGEWQPYALGTNIEMYEGDKLQFICSLEHGIISFNNAEHQYKGFDLEGSFKVSGELNSLISSKKCTDIPIWSYWRLFRDIGADVVLNVDDLVIQGWNTYEYGCDQLFSNDLSSSTSRIEGTLHIDTYVPYGYSYFRVAYQQYGLECVDFGGNEIETIQASGFTSALANSGIQSIRGLKLVNGNINSYAMQDFCNGCTSLSELEMDVNYTANQIGQAAFYNAFNGCTSLQTIDGTLDFSKAISTSNDSFKATFANSGLVDASNIIFPEDAWIGPYTYLCTFMDCTALVTPPSKIAIKSTDNKMPNQSLAQTFRGCTALTRTPEIVMPEVNDNRGTETTFDGCTSLQDIYIDRFELQTGGATNMYLGVPSSGTYHARYKYFNPNIPRGTATIPSGWTLDYDELGVGVLKEGCYFMTDYHPNQNTRIRMWVNTHQPMEYYFGCWDNAYNRQSFSCCNDSNGTYWGWFNNGGTIPGTFNGPLPNGEHIVEINKNVAYVDGIQQYSWTNTTYTTSTTLAIGNQNRIGVIKSQFSTGCDFSRVLIEENGVTVHDWSWQDSTHLVDAVDGSTLTMQGYV